MAKFKLSDAQRSMLGAVVQSDPEQQHIMLRERVRAVFDGAIYETREFDEALLAVFFEGLNTSSHVQAPKRRRRKTTDGEAPGRNATGRQGADVARSED
jgi:hypothetical protein